MVVLLNEQDQVLYQRRFANHLPTILEPLAPHQADITGVVVESTYKRMTIPMPVGWPICYDWGYYPKETFTPRPSGPCAMYCANART